MAEQSKADFQKRINILLAVPSIKIYYKAIVIKTWHWHRNRQLNQCYQTKSLETDPSICKNLIFDKKEKRIIREIKDRSIIVLGQLAPQAKKKMKSATSSQIHILQTD